MKLSTALILLGLILAQPLLITADESIRFDGGILEIYADARPSLLGRAPDRSRILRRDLNTAAPGAPRGFQVPVETALLVSDETYSALKRLSSSGGMSSDGSLAVQALGEMSYRIEFLRLGIAAEYRFDPPGEKLTRVVDDYYLNIYWEEEVLAEYDGNYTLTVLAAADLMPPSGRVDFYDAMAAATMIADKHQPLYGIRDGLGLLDGLGYALVEHDNRRSDRLQEYREFSTNQTEMRDLLLRLSRVSEEIPASIHTLVGSMVQFERDSRFLLPEELLFEGEGDCLELALAYYDLLRRFGYEAKILALRFGRDSVPEECPYVTVYQREEFGPWGYLSPQEIAEPEYRSWEEIPAAAVREKVFYHPVDPEILMRELAPGLPDFAAWSLSIY